MTPSRRPRPENPPEPRPRGPGHDRSLGHRSPAAAGRREPPGRSPRRPCAANTSSTPWASTCRSRASSGSSSTRRRGQVQSAYQIIVSTDPKAAAGDIWDSGKVASAKSTQIAFAGKALESGKSYFWKVRTWDRDGRESAWSAVARFDTGLFNKSGLEGRLDRQEEPAPQGVHASRAGSSGPGPTSPASAITSCASTAARPATTSSTRPGRPTTSASST